MSENELRISKDMTHIIRVTETITKIVCMDCGKVWNIQEDGWIRHECNMDTITAPTTK